jgi:[acyl-carrier-protein] S-malonyltransferase
MSLTAVLFPGQGSLTADSGERARAACPELTDLACELAGGDVFARAAESTRFAQPAIFVTSMAGWRERDAEPAGAMAGHSLGELSALAAAGAIDVEDALRLVVLRGNLMSGAASVHPGSGMVALLGASPEEATALAFDCGVEVANDNAPGQIVVSGDANGLQAVTDAARAAGVKAITLDVAGAFHSQQMAPAEPPFLRALESVEIREPAVPVISGLTARPFADVRRELTRALTSPVRWREVMATLVELGATRFADVGPGVVLDRLVKRNLRALEGHVVTA